MTDMTDSHQGISKKSQIFQPFLLVFVAPIALIISIVLAFPPHWMTIDDVTMSLALAGLTGAPDEHIKCMHPIIGFLLKGLYLSSQSIPWYGFFHLLLHSIGLSFILYALLLSRKTAEALVLFCIFFFAAISSLCAMQYTSTAFVLAQGGFVLMLAFAGNLSGTKRRHLLVLSSFAFLVSFMVRWRVAEISLCITLVYTVILYAKHKFSNAKEALIAIVIIFALGEALHFGFVCFYETDPNWKGFFKWHGIVNDYADFDRVKADSAALSKANWSNNDLAMMRCFTYLDTSVFNNQTAGAVLSASKTTARANLNQEYIAKELARLFSDPSSVISLVLLALANFGLFITGKEWLKNAVLLAVVLAIDCVLICLLKSPQYIFVPLWGFPLLATLLRAPPECLSSKRRLVAIGAVALACIVGICVLQQNEARQARNRRLILIREIANIKPTPEQLYILMPFSLPISNISPFDNPLQIFKGFNIMNSSTIYSLQARQLKRFGTHDFRKLISNPDVRFLASDYVDSANQVEKFAAEHYHLKVKLNTVYHSDELHYGAYKPEVLGSLN